MCKSKSSLTKYMSQYAFPKQYHYIIAKPCLLSWPWDPKAPFKALRKLVPCTGLK